MGLSRSHRINSSSCSGDSESVLDVGGPGGESVSESDVSVRSAGGAARLLSSTLVGTSLIVEDADSISAIRVMRLWSQNCH